MSAARAAATLVDIARTLDNIVDTSSKGSLRRARALQLATACLLRTLVTLQRIYADVVLLPVTRDVATLQRL